MRKIIHIDMDAFFASIEQRDNPDLRGKPVAVGMGKERGVVAAASYEARKFGVRSAMPSLTAKAKCPELIFVPSRFEQYKEVSRQIMEIFLEYTDLVEPLSLDEAFLDVTTNHKNIASAILIAREIKEKIYKETQLTASAGVSINKFLAKIASDYRKPNGLFVILPNEVEIFVEQLPINSFFGVGKITAKKMRHLGIYTGADLKKWSREGLIRYFGKAGIAYYDYARGIDNRPVIPDRVIKSVGAENTFEQDLNNPTTILVELYYVAKRVWSRIVMKDFHGKTITLKVKYADFEIISRSKTIPRPVVNFNQFWTISKELLKLIDYSQRKIRLMGLSLSNAEESEDNRQLELEF
ncbi:DNA polymerase IV [Bacteroidales bacterium OttesenSCG-928-B11]|nr:DNA polymerase IV [Bacteroidales bacterium OttesenSCG-928-E04]MDL2312997.1 DNA polymerase IV [Bacteroidales bacterium OttesenSCG-928-B11]